VHWPRHDVCAFVHAVVTSPVAESKTVDASPIGVDASILLIDAEPPQPVTTKAPQIARLAQT
jgi:hypothetical protein